MYRRNGTSGLDQPNRETVAAYREFAPRPELRAHVRAFFSFVPVCEVAPSRHRVTREVAFDRGSPFTAPTFADPGASIVMNLGMRCRMERGWSMGEALDAQLLGPMTRAIAAAPDGFARTVGVYFHPGGASAFVGMPLDGLADRIVSLTDVWGSAAADLPAELEELSEGARIDRFESELVRHFAARRTVTSVDVPGLARWAQGSPGGVTVERMAQAAGVSRQRLTRVFRQVTGVSPKLYCRLARFQTALAYADAGARVDWSRVAMALGYADQSHMIGEFREFSSLTPARISSRRVFHPFIAERGAGAQNDIRRGRPRG